MAGKHLLIQLERVHLSLQPGSLSGSRRHHLRLNMAEHGLPLEETLLMIPVLLHRQVHKKWLNHLKDPLMPGRPHRRLHRRLPPLMCCRMMVLRLL